MAALVLFASSLSALVLLIVHSWRRRGGRVTATFFLGGAVFGILRGNGVYYICQSLSEAGKGSKPYLPQGGFLPHVGHESPQVVIGWLFAGYLAWTFSEFVLRRLGREDRLFPTVALSALFMCCIGYCMETTATHVGWWYWDISTVNPYFGLVPLAGIAAWFSIATDFIFPALFIVCSEYRRSPWRWLTLLVFPLHMGAHLLYGTVPYIDEIYSAMALAVAGLALFNRTRLETGLVKRSPTVPTSQDAPPGPASVVDYIPAITVSTFFLILLDADVLKANDFTLAFTCVPLAIFALSAWRNLPLVVAAAVAAAGVSAWPWIGFRALYAFAPLAAFGVLWTMGRAKRARAAGLAWMALGVILAGLFVRSEKINNNRLVGYVRLLNESRDARLRGFDDRSRRLREEALGMQFSDANSVWWSIKYLVLANPGDAEGSMPEVLKRYAELVRMDPHWAFPWIEWAGCLAADNRLTEAMEKVRRLIGYQPTVGSHHALLGYLLLRDGRVDEARVELEGAVERGDIDASTRINLALALALTGEGTKAVEVLRRVLADNPEHPVARLDWDDLKNAPAKLRADLAHIAAPDKFGFLGVLPSERADKRVAARDLASAVRLMEQAVHYTPCSAMFRANYGALLAQSGAPLELAVEQSLMAVKIDPRLESARRNLGELSPGLARQQIARGDVAGARVTLENALNHASGDYLPQIQKMLRDLPNSSPVP